MKMRGRLDMEHQRIDFHGEGLGLDDLEEFTKWLLQAQRWMKRKKHQAAGGWRWEFDRPLEGPPVARRMSGADRFASANLVIVRPKTDKKCDCCGAMICSRELAWRQASGQYAGFSKSRFCDGCVTRGGRRPPTVLRIISGGKSQIGKING